jgi:hypothetical protein
LRIAGEDTTALLRVLSQVDPEHLHTVMVEVGDPRRWLDLEAVSAAVSVRSTIWTPHDHRHGMAVSRSEVPDERQ